MAVRIERKADPGDNPDQPDNGQRDAGPEGETVARPVQRQPGGK